MNVAHQVLREREAQIIGRMIYITLKPGRTYYGHTSEVMTGGRRAARQWHADRALGYPLGDHNKAISQLANETKVSEKLGFEAPHQVEAGAPDTLDGEATGS